MIIILLNFKITAERIQGQEEEAYLAQVKQKQTHLREHYGEKNQKRPRKDSSKIENGNNDEEMNG